MKLTELQKYLIPAVALLQQQQTYIPFSLPSLNMITGGGIPVGRMSDFVGLQGAGKTTLSFDIIRQAQKQDIHVYYADQEVAFNARYAQSLGVDLAKMTMVEVGTMEETLTRLEEVILKTERSLLVLDSINWLIPAAALEEEPKDAYDVERKIGEYAKKLGFFCMRVSKPLVLRQNTLLFINQFRANISSLSRIDKKPSGPYAYHHALSLRLELVTVRKNEDADEVQVTVTKNRTAPSRRSATVKLVHGRGFDAGADVLQHAIRLGLIEKRGSWYISSRTGEKVQGETSAITTFCTTDLAQEVAKMLHAEANNDTMD